ncbi:hypothetical protein [Pseudomonas sp. RGB]|uniref:hypothetical protein n=1 Tax=Pseudomonas sp. RGB TaxID=2598474 RepID=UPI002114C2B1|nr:hypothetical protein [Pseudomonas sp. RGB]
MQPIYIDFLNGLDIDALNLSNEEILTAIQASLALQGRGEAVIEPRTHLIPGGGINGHFTGLGAAVDTPVADRVEDYAGQALAVVDKTRR